MNVFVSWSGEKSGDVAQALREWLPSVVHAVEPFVSSKDIGAGMRWQAEIAKELDDTDFGLICVTRENQASEWLNFEAGALAKSVNFSRVVPLAIDLSPAEIANPLGQFQAMRLGKEDMSEVLVSINEACPTPISESNLRKGVDKWWPDLEIELERIESRRYEADGAPSSPARTDRELLEEVLDSVRGLRREAPAANATLSGRQRVESAVSALEGTLSSGPFTAWSVLEEGDNVTLKTSPPPDADLRAAAKIVGAAHGVKFHLGTLKAKARGAGAEPGAPAT